MARKKSKRFLKAVDKKRKAKIEKQKAKKRVKKPNVRPKKAESKRVKAPKSDRKLRAESYKLRTRNEAKERRAREKSERAIPDGFEKVPKRKKPLAGLSDTIQTAGDKIRLALNKARERMINREGLEPNEPQVHEYLAVPGKDYNGEVDGEIRVDGMRGMDTIAIIHKMMESMLPYDVLPKDRESILGKGYWISVGVRWHGKSEYDSDRGTWKITVDEEKNYDKDAGMLGVSSNYRSMYQSSKIQSAFNAVALRASNNPNPMFKNIEKKFRRKISQVFIRINWNPENAQPKRHGTG